MNAVTKPEGPTAAQVFRQQLEQRLDQFVEALPPHITVERFKSTIMWAVMADPALLAADRVSLFESCLQAANDGLIPDKKQGALVVYNTKLPKENKNDRDVWIKKVQWLPMVRGVVDKIYNTGKVKSVDTAVVYGGDHFRYWKDDAGEHLEHEPSDNQDRNVIRRVYARVIMKDDEGGGRFAEVLYPADIEKIKSASKTADSGPWVKWWDQMAIKSAIKRLAKRLPISRDIETVLSRDDFLYDMQQPAQIGRAASGSLSSRLDEVTGGARALGDHTNSDDRIAMDTGNGSEKETASVKNQKPASTRNHAPNSPDAGSPSSDSSPKEGDQAAGSKSSQEPAANDPSEDAKAYRAGREARAKGVNRKAIPAEYRKVDSLTNSWLEGYDEQPESQQQEG